MILRLLFRPSSLVVRLGHGIIRKKTFSAKKMDYQKVMLADFFVVDLGERALVR